MRPVPTLEDLVQDGSAVPAGEAVGEELRELVRLVAGEARRLGKERPELLVEEQRGGPERHVVEEGARAEPDRAVAERRMDILQIALVVPDLTGWVEMVA
jgi:hypothetical protein